MKRIQTCGNLHSFHLIDRIPIRHIDPCLLQSRPSIGETVFYDKVLGTLCIYKGRNIRVSGSNDRSHIFHSCVLQFSLNGISRARRDFINHGPRKGYLLAIGQICDKPVLHILSPVPFLCHGGNGFLKLFSVVGAIVHGYHCQRRFSGFISFV